MLRLSVLGCVLLFACTSASADEPKKKPDAEKLPAPKVKVEPSIYVMPYIPPRTDTREVWQHYGVGPLGRFVPRVIVTPHGAYYSRTLDEYPWVQNRQSAVMPQIVD